MISTSQLWIGNHEALVQKLYAYAIDLFGGAHGDAIRERQFHAIRWFSPEKNQYTRADLEPLFHHLSLAAHPGVTHLVVLERADLLSLACANSLLKLLEEPPAGYAFILLAQSLEVILPTIQSRCIVTEHVSDGGDQHFLMLLSIFKSPVPGGQLRVMQELEKATLTEHKSRLALDQLVLHWSDQYRKALQAGNEQDGKFADRMMRIIAHMSEHPPMPGSVKLFWRTLYLLMTL